MSNVTIETWDRSQLAEVVALLDVASPFDRFYARHVGAVMSQCFWQFEHVLGGC